MGGEVVNVYRENVQLIKAWFLCSGRGYEWEGELTIIVSGKALAAHFHHPTCTLVRYH